MIAEADNSGQKKVASVRGLASFGESSCISKELLLPRCSAPPPPCSPSPFAAAKIQHGNGCKPGEIPMEECKDVAWFPRQLRGLSH